MLHLVGLGLDDDEITGKGVKAIKESEKVFAEFYTNTETVDIEALEEKTDTEIEKLSREEVERKDQIIESAEKQNTVFLVSGDPLTATTHYDIKHRAEQKDIGVDVVHAPSIFISVAETGLNVYKFGRTVTLPEHASPDSIIEHIEKNDSIGLHTLILLDINYDAGDAAQKLVEMSSDLEDREALILERANLHTQNIVHGELNEVEPEGETPHCIVLVGEKSHKEEENLSSYDQT